MKRKIKEIILHCSATPEGKDFTVEQIRKWHKEGNGWSDIGYHFVIYRDGTVHIGRPLSQPGAHTKGHNLYSVGVCYIGGLDIAGKYPKDTRTPEQKEALVALLKRLKSAYPNAKIFGHNDFAAKACPSFKISSDPALCAL